MSVRHDNVSTSRTFQLQLTLNNQLALEKHDVTGQKTPFKVHSMNFLHLGFEKI